MNRFPPPSIEAAEQVPLRPYTTLKAGGPAEFLTEAHSADELARTAAEAQDVGCRTTYLGSGSNVLPSDDGVPGLVILNCAHRIEVGPSGEVVADTGCAFQDLFLKTAQAGLRGLEFAVGIPGSLGGALVSNAGAYGGCVSDFLTDLEVVIEGERKWVAPEAMRFGYRDSILRQLDPPDIALLRARFRMPRGDAKTIYDTAREYQRQRIVKQPAPASAGSFFKNIHDRELAEAFPKLPKYLKELGVVPAGFLIEEVGLRGHRYKGAVFGPKHANFIVNVGGASAFAIRSLAELAKRRVYERFGLLLEEEVLYLGDWSRFTPDAVN